MAFQDLPEPPEIGNGAGKPVQAVDPDLLNDSLFHVPDQLLKGRTVGVFAGEALVLIDLYLLSGLSAAQVDLPLNREAVRLVHRLPGIDRVQGGRLLSFSASVLPGAGRV